MKELIIFFLLCFHGLNAEGVEDDFKEDILSIYKHTAFSIKNAMHENITSDNVRYYLFTKSSPKNFKIIDPSDPQPLATKVDLLFFIIHGWNERRNVTWYADLKNGLLSRKGNNAVVQVDWSGPANQRYPQSANNTEDVGHIIGQSLADLYKKYGVRLGTFFLIGHSLGAHVCGFAGKKFLELTGKRISRIVALDAAGPLFELQPDSKRLAKTDAKCVHAIHTDGGTFGRSQSYGTIDFFPNGGKSQPGCKQQKFLKTGSIKATVSCDHKRSFKYFTEAIWNPGTFIARKCNNYWTYQKGSCDKEKADMGDLKTEQTGDFYLETNSEKPFAKKKPGFVSSLGRRIFAKLLKFLNF